MVSRVDPDRWLSTAEFFRASLPDDEVGARGGPDEQARYYAEAHPPVYGATAPAWLERRPIDRKGYQEQKQSADQPTINNWAREETQPANSLQIVIGRQPLPPSVDAAAVCKTSSKPIEHRPWATYCEIRALDAIHQYYIDHPNEFRHIPVPRVYTTSHQHGESALPFHREELSYIIMEHIKDNSSLHSSFRSGDQGWTRRQKRRFVRKMALMRLQLLFIRNNPSRIEPPMQYRGLLSSTIDKKSSVKYPGVTYWQPHFNPPYPNNSSWVQSHLALEYRYWMTVLYADDVGFVLVPHNLPPDFSADAWVTRLRELRGRLRDPAAHSFRNEPFHVLTHQKFSRPNDPILMKGKKLSCIVDWDNSGYLPVSENVRDILKQYEGGGLADPDTWDENAEPFSKCRSYNWSWDDWIENMRINRWQSSDSWEKQQKIEHEFLENRISFQDRYNWYGRITPNDYRYGDKYADQDIDEDDGTSRGTKVKISVPIGPAEQVKYVSNDAETFTNSPDLEWWHGPVMHLVNDYVRTHLPGDFPRNWSWPDPLLDEWARRPTVLGEPLGMPV